MWYQLAPNTLVKIFSYLGLRDLIKLEQVHRNFKGIIRNYPWSHFIVRLTNIKDIEFVVTRYKFRNYSFSKTNITDELVRCISDGYAVDLLKSKDNTSEAGYLSLDLSGCDRITDASVIHLKDCYYLNLAGCSKITDASVKFLGNCHTLNLARCNKITDVSVKYL